MSKDKNYKYVLYLEDVQRGIVITDDQSESSEKIIGEITAAMSGAKIIKFRTKTDCLIIRPNKIMAIHLQNLNDDLSNIEQVTEVEVIDSESDIANLNSIIPELDLGDDMELIDSVIDEGDDINEILSQDTLIKEDVKTPEEVDVEAEVQAWHSELDNNT